MEPRTVHPPEELDVATAGELDAMLEGCDGGDRCVVDMAAVTFCDSSGVRVLTSHALRHNDAGGTLELRNTSATVQRVFKIAGVDGLLLTSGT